MSRFAGLRLTSAACRAQQPAPIIMFGTFVYPLLAFAFVFAEEIVTVVYTAAYVDAAPVMRVYIVGLLALVIEVASITFLLQQGAFVMQVNLLVLALSVALSWVSAHHFGLAGAAVGSVLAVYLDGIVTLRRIALRTGIPIRRCRTGACSGSRYVRRAGRGARLDVRALFAARGRSSPTDGRGRSWRRPTA